MREAHFDRIERSIARCRVILSAAPFAIYLDPPEPTVILPLWCGSVSAMDEMPMPGGWTLSMAWMRMPGQRWPAWTDSPCGPAGLLARETDACQFQ